MSVPLNTTTGYHPRIISPGEETEWKFTG